MKQRSWWWFALALAGCGGNSSDGSDAGADALVNGDASGDAAVDSGAEPPIEALARCGLAGHWDFSQRVYGDPSLNTPPCKVCYGYNLGDIGIGEDGQPQLAYGPWLLPASLNAETCTLSVDTCAEIEDEEVLELQADAHLEGGELIVNLSYRQIDAHWNDQRDAVEGARLYGTPTEATCEFHGAWQLATPPTLTEGACGLSWESTAFSITEGSTCEIKWEEGASLDGNLANLDTCQLTVREGYEDDWEQDYYDGTLRHTTITLTVVGDTAAGEITDQLDGPTSEGLTCDATFTFSAERRRLALPRTCDPRLLAYAERDGRCEPERGETCLNSKEDCGCGDGLDCVGDPAFCAEPCTLGANDCPDGMLCDHASAPYEFDETYCLPNGLLPEGAFCGRTGDLDPSTAPEARCVPGLICHFSGHRVSRWIEYGTCMPRCTPGDASTCGTICDPELNAPSLGGCLSLCTSEDQCPGESSFCYRYHQNENYASCASLPSDVVPPKPNELCGMELSFGFDAACQGGAICLEFNDETERHCRVPCDGGCPAEAPECVSGFCRPGRARPKQGEACEPFGVQCEAPNNCLPPCSGDDCGWMCLPFCTPDCPSGYTCGDEHYCLPEG